MFGILTSIIENFEWRYIIMWAIGGVLIYLAIKKEMVLVIDGDMRRATLSKYIDSPSIGLSDYLAKGINTPEEAIITDDKHTNLHIMPVGPIRATLSGWVVLFLLG